jgi:hypothetical protein
MVNTYLILELHLNAPTVIDSHQVSEILQLPVNSHLDENTSLWVYSTENKVPLAEMEFDGDLNAHLLHLKTVFLTHQRSIETIKKLSAGKLSLSIKWASDEIYCNGPSFDFSSFSALDFLGIEELKFGITALENNEPDEEKYCSCS